MAKIININSGKAVLKIDEWKHYETIPEHTRGALLRYRDKGYEPGGFLASVLANELMGAVSRADGENKHVLKEICNWIYHRMPSSSWGNSDKVEAWIGHAGASGRLGKINQEAEQDV
jgi:hypothetical protein